jgi:hypothetical protein
MNATLKTMTGIYKFLLHLYPRTYREEFAEEMLLDFTDMAMDASKKGTCDFVLFLLRELIDFPVSLLKTYFEETTMKSIFRPQAARNILRIALAFGLALALDTFAGVIAFLDQIPLPAIWRLWHSFGWRGTYQDIQAILLSVSGLVLGPVLATIILLAIFPEMRPIKRYLPVLALAFALPSMLGALRSTVFKNLALTFEDTIFALAGYILIGLGLGLVASLISQERRKILWLLAAGPLGLFFTSWGMNVLTLRFQVEHSATLWGAVASVALRNIFMGMIVGLLLGVVVEFKRQNNFPTHFSTS